MKHLFYVRHGETHMNVEGLLSGQVETPLTDNGKQQAIAAGNELKQKGIKIDLIICSPYERAVHTARLMARQIAYPEDKIQQNDMFIERSFGILEGTNGKRFLDRHEYREFDDVENAETIEALHERAAKAYEYIQTLEAKNILIVGHGSFGRAIRRVVKGLPYTDEYVKDSSIGNAAVVELL